MPVNFISKFKLVPAITIVLLWGFNNNAIAANSNNKYFLSQVKEMNRRSIASVAGNQTQAIIQTVEELVEGYNNKDVPAIMAAIDPNSQEFNTLESYLERTFQDTSFYIEIERIKFVEVERNQAKIKLTYEATTRYKNKFDRQQYTDVMNLQKINGKWKFIE